MDIKWWAKVIWYPLSYLSLIGFYNINLFHCEIVSAVCTFKLSRMYNSHHITDKNFRFFISIKVIPRKHSLKLQKNANCLWFIQMYISKWKYIYNCNTHFHRILQIFIVMHCRFYIQTDDFFIYETRKFQMICLYWVAGRKHRRK